MLVSQSSLDHQGECVTREVLSDLHPDSELVQCFRESSRRVIQYAGAGCGGLQLPWCEQWMDIGRCGVWSGSGVYIQVMGKCVQLGTQSPWAETDLKVELGKILQPSCLLMCELLRGSEVL